MIYDEAKMKDALSDHALDMRRLAVWLVKNRAEGALAGRIDPDDVFQEAVYNALRFLKTTGGACEVHEVKKWLKILVRNAFTDALRKAGKEAARTRSLDASSSTSQARIGRGRRRAYLGPGSAPAPPRLDRSRRR